jgi:enoyl-CoA hydratase/carnithine racemase
MTQIRSERRGSVELLTLDRPKALNALDRAMLEELLECCERIRADLSLRAVVLTGAGRAFAAGADIAVCAGEKIASNGPLAVSSAKRVVQKGHDVELATAHALEQVAFGLISASADRAEGMDAFLEKRAPSFENH